MKGKDEIADLFKEQLSQLKVSVDPSVWKGVSSSLGSTASATSTIGSILSKSTLLTKVAAISVGVVGIGLGSYYLVNNDGEKISSTETVVTEDILPDNSVEETVEVSLMDTLIENKEELSSPVELIKESQENVTDSQEYILENLTNEVELLSGDYIPTSTIDESNNSSNLNDKSRENINITNHSKSNQNEIATVVEVQTEKEERETDFEVPELIINYQKIDNQLYRFEVDSDKFTSIQWEFDAVNYTNGKSTEYYFSRAGEHIVTVSGYFQNELVTNQLSINIEIKGQLLNLPTVFTPDNDGVNDLFFIESNGLSTFNLTIFDQNRKVVFQTDVVDFTWDGVHQFTNEKVAAGDYYYIIAAEDESGNHINSYQRLKIIY